MKKELTEDMLTGVEEIDNQHRDLLQRVSELIEASKALRGETEIAMLIWFLKRYVRKHFRDEESLQLKAGFPDYRDHKAQHDWFFREVLRFESRYSREGASTAVVVQALTMMGHWMRNHFSNMDGYLAEHLRRMKSRGD